MDICHILLGRPWQCDYCTIHDGYGNKFTFVKGDIKIKLGPTREKTHTRPTLLGDIAILTNMICIQEIPESGDKGHG